jgi:tetratricopeptide (TPR) repeat protein
MQISPENNAYAYFQLGNAYLQKGDAKSAVKNYETAFKINPHFAVAIGSVALVYQNLGQLNQSVKYYQKAISADPSFWEGYYYLARIYSSQGKTDLAGKEFNKASQINPALSGQVSNPVSNPVLSEKHSFTNGVSFTYPASFSLIKTDKGVILKDKVSDFTITLESSTMQEGITAQDYLGSQQTLYGILINQGLAKIPNMDFAYVKIWILSNSTQMDQFFLFTNGKVIEVRVSPANSILMKTFDRIIGGMKLK